MAEKTFVLGHALPVGTSEGGSTPRDEVGQDDTLAASMVPLLGAHAETGRVAPDDEATRRARRAEHATPSERGSAKAAWAPWICAATPSSAARSR